MMGEFKAAVSKVLTKHASAILLDTEFGIPAIKAKDPKAGLLLAYENSGYDNTKPGRIPDLIDGVSVRRLVEDGADAIKILLYYSTEDTPEVNNLKSAWIERIGAECAANDVPFFLECIAYDVTGKGENTLEFAKKKPKEVVAYTKEFSKPQYRVDVLKNELPFNVAFMKDSKANKTGEVAYDRSQVKDLIAEAAAASSLPFIYLSAGVDDDVFRESLEMAGEAGAPYGGVLCGRATWKEGIPVYAKQGVQALEAWLEDRGVKNIQALNEVLNRTAKPWYEKIGGKDNIEVID
jgi:tagatose 1,6-diphosphate aldolase